LGKISFICHGVLPRVDHFVCVCVCVINCTLNTFCFVQVTFIMLHWIKGCPDDSTQGEYNGLTLYEQIDAGVPWTSSKKFLILVPTLLCLVACFTADYKPFYIVVNCGIMLICVVGKMPQMHRVRIFGINSTPGIDQPIEYSPPSGSVSKHKSKKHM